MKGIAGANTSGNKPPLKAAKLGKKETRIALLKPHSSKTKIRMALTSGPVSQGEWIKNGKNIATPVKVKNCVSH